MKDLDTEKKIAVLIDAENTQYSMLDAILVELSKHGHILVKRGYGDFSSAHLKNWKQPLNELAITPVQQFSYTQGKNSSDAAMIIDAMDLLYSDKFDAFALVSSDSDFTKLASRLRESQIYVFGVGKSTTPLAFKNACDDFISIEVLQKLESVDTSDNADNVENKEKTVAPVRKTKAELCCDTRLVNILRSAISENADDDGWADLGSCGQLIKRQYPDFDSRTYGYSSLTKLIEVMELFQIDRRLHGSGKAQQVYVKDKRA